MKQKKKTYQYRLPIVDGMFVVLKHGKLDEALSLARRGEIDVEEIDEYLVAEWN